MSDPIAISARATASRLTDLGPNLIAEVEAALYARGSEQSTTRYTDPVAIGGLIVNICTLAWTVYIQLRREAKKPSPDVMARSIRVEQRKRGIASSESEDRIIDVVVTEIIRTADDQHPH